MPDIIFEIDARIYALFEDAQTNEDSQDLINILNKAELEILKLRIELKILKKDANYE